MRKEPPSYYGYLMPEEMDILRYADEHWPDSWIFSFLGSPARIRELALGAYATHSEIWEMRGKIYKRLLKDGDALSDMDPVLVSALAGHYALMREHEREGRRRAEAEEAKREGSYKKYLRNIGKPLAEREP